MRPALQRNQDARKLNCFASTEPGGVRPGIIKSVPSPPLGMGVLLTDYVVVIKLLVLTLVIFDIGSFNLR